MIDAVLKRLARIIYGKSLRKQVAESIARDKQEASTYVAARYTRGNVAIQQGRFDMRKLPR